MRRIRPGLLQWLKLGESPEALLICCFVSYGAIEHQIIYVRAYGTRRATADRHFALSYFCGQPEGRSLTSGEP